MDKGKVLEEIKEFIDSVQWRYAETMPEHPHEYTIREWNMEVEDTFISFIEYIREYGYQKRFFRKMMTYCDIGDYTYWTMGAPIEETTVINRKER